MKMKNNSDKISMLLVFIIFLLILLPVVSCDDSSDFDSSLILSNCNFNLICKTESINYSKGECIHIFGNISSVNSNSHILFDNVTISMKHKQWSRSTIISLDNNTFDYYYNISYGDSEGLWNISATVEVCPDDFIIDYKNINISLPSDIIRYKVVWYSPPEDAIYHRGSSFNFSVFVSEDGVGVKNAKTTCILPSFDLINLTEITQGYYRGSYTIPWDCKIGLWFLSIDSITGSGSSLKSGGANTSITIKPATLKMDIIEPKLDKYNIGEKIILKINLKYDDDSFVNNATVIANILNENITLNQTDNGTYISDYKIDDENEGGLIIQFFSSDRFLNNASVSKIIFLNKYQGQNILTIIISFISIIIIIFAIIFLYFIWNKFSFLHSQDIKFEIEELHKLQNEAAINYYSKGTITRETYDLLRKEHLERLSELEKQSIKKNE